MIDDRYLPVVVCTWKGRVNESLLHKYFEWKVPYITHVGRDDPIVLVHDFARVARPSAGVRREAHKLNEATRARTDPCILQIIGVVTNPVIRGALQAISWMSPTGLTTVVERSRPEALTTAIRLLERDGRSGPAGLDVERYTLPPTTLGTRHMS